MVIVKILGGLGNQLFQYALYRNLQEMEKEVYLDISVLDTDEYRKKNNKANEEDFIYYRNQGRLW